MKKNNSDYKKCTEIFNEISEMMLSDIPMSSTEESEKKLVYFNCAKVSGPALCSYVLWILKQAQTLNLKHLYFLARDAKIMYDIANIFTEHYHLEIKCHYLYCSRLCLRRTLYCIDKDEALEKMCVNGLKVTPIVMMERTGLNNEEIDAVFRDIGYDQDNITKVLSGKGLENLRRKLKNSRLFDELMFEASSRSFEDTISYFRQEGLLSNSEYAIVDSGWTGSMQRCIRMILEKANCHTQLCGFYFGIFCKTAHADGIYKAYYFNNKQNIWNSILFNHNLFECWCMAEHGMTLGYQTIKSDKIRPILSEYRPQWFEHEQAIYHREYANRLANHLEWSIIDTNKLLGFIKRKIRLASICPDQSTSEVYGKIPFCDDPTESYKIPLASHVSFENLTKNLLITRLYTKFFASEKTNGIYESFWPEATISYLTTCQRLLLKTDKLIEYILKAIRKAFSL